MSQIAPPLAQPMRRLGEAAESLQFYDDSETTYRQMASLMHQGRIDELELVAKHAVVRSRFDAKAWFYLSVALIFFQRDGDIAAKRDEGMEYLRHAAQMKSEDAIVTLKAIEEHGATNPKFFTITPDVFPCFLEDFKRKNSVYDRYPMTIIIETQTICNAKCTFCGYHKLARKGTKMTDELLNRLLDEMKTIPVPFNVYFNGMNEPFADKRIFDIYDTVQRDIPNAMLHIITNGTLLTADRQPRLFPLRKVHLNISLNESDAETYEKIIGLSFAKVVANLDALHENVKAGHITFPVAVSRVNDGSPADAQFQQFITSRYPLFECVLKEMTDYGKAFERDTPTPLLPCRLWYFSVVLATGEMALCCPDHHGGILKEDANVKPLLEIYNGEQHRRYRQSFSVHDIAPCRTCRLITP